MKPAGRVLVLGAPFGGEDRAAEAIAEAMQHSSRGALAVEVADFYRRFAPRLASLAALAHRTDAAFLPDGSVSLLELTRSTPDAPAVRELAAGAVAALESAVATLRPVAVVSTDQVAAAAAAELRGRYPFVAVTVVCDLMPRRMWAHPDADLLCVAGDEAREQAALHGVAWERIAVTGVPARGSYTDPPAPARPRVGAPMSVAIVAPAERAAVRQALVKDIAGAGADAVDVGTGDPAAVVRAAGLVVCAGGGELLWSAPAAGVPLLLLGDVPAAQRAGADLLVAAGAALPVRDGAHLADTVAHLVRRPERVRALREAAAAFGRPAAARSVAERVAALIRG
ncbi:MAG: hypothetical protein Q7W30_01380 [Coriobacteriia bacterium]|nr:hypothetical protein [Coriobacteriia bacterium]